MSSDRSARVTGQKPQMARKEPCICMSEKCVQVHRETLMRATGESHVERSRLWEAEGEHCRQRPERERPDATDARGVGHCAARSLAQGETQGTSLTNSPGTRLALTALCSAYSHLRLCLPHAFRRGCSHTLPRAHSSLSRKQSHGYLVSRLIAPRRMRVLNHSHNAALALFSRVDTSTPSRAHGRRSAPSQSPCSCTPSSSPTSRMRASRSPPFPASADGA